MQPLWQAKYLINLCLLLYGDQGLPKAVKAILLFYSEKELEKGRMTLKGAIRNFLACSVTTHRWASSDESHLHTPLVPSKMVQ